MSVDIRVPSLGESIVTATVGRWLKAAGDAVAMDEPVVELETDKVSVEVGASAAGILREQKVAQGEEVEVGAVLAIVEPGDGKAVAKKEASNPSPVPAPAAEPPVARSPAAPAPAKPSSGGGQAFPAAAKMMKEAGVSAQKVGAGSGKGSRITKGDVQAFLARGEETVSAPVQARVDDPREKRVKMTRLRVTIAKRLKQAQNTAAILTTFNEIDMSAAMKMRADFREGFEKAHGVKLGFMSIFVRACVDALHEFPAVNAEIDGTDILYRPYVNMGIAVGGANGLVVPVLRDVQDMGYAEIEKTIAGLGRKARDGSLKLDELSGGTFSITNGGIYGSLMSTPIINPPQSAILGMHSIQDRPVAVDGQVVIRPMMYVALSYDHRIIDGREAVSFLVRVKENVEDPRRLLLRL